jgi:hypothetical protein
MIQKHFITLLIGASLTLYTAHAVSNNNTQQDLQRGMVTDLQEIAKRTITSDKRLLNDVISALEGVKRNITNRVPRQETLNNQQRGSPSIVSRTAPALTQITSQIQGMTRAN